MADVPLMNNPMTTAGDVVYGGASGVPSRLGVGTAGQVLKVNAGATAPEWGSTSAVGNLWKMAKSATLGNQTLTNNTSDLITFDTAEIDGGSSVIDLANERFVVPATGFYEVSAYWRWGSTAPVTSKAIEIRNNGTACALERGDASTGNIQTDGTQTLFAPLSFAAGDLLTMFVNPGAVTGATANGTNALHTRCWFALKRVT